MGSIPRARFVLLVLACALGTAACAGGGASTTRPAGSSSTRIVQEELETLHQLTVLDAIRRLRPQWLQSRSGFAPQVRMDGNFMGSVGNLRSVRAADVQEMRYLNAADATTRFGTNYVSGVILVTTKR